MYIHMNVYIYIYTYLFADILITILSSSSALNGGGHAPGTSWSPGRGRAGRGPGESIGMFIQNWVIIFHMGHIYIYIYLHLYLHTYIYVYIHIEYIAKLVIITPILLWFIRLGSLVSGVYEATYNVLGPHIVDIDYIEQDS